MKLGLLAIAFTSALAVASACSSSQEPAPTGVAGAAGAADVGDDMPAGGGGAGGEGSPQAAAGDAAGGAAAPSAGAPGAGGAAGGGGAGWAGAGWAGAGQAGSAGEGGDDTGQAGAADQGGAGGAGPTLLGGEVQFSVHCCSAPPSAANLVSTVQAAAIVAGVEFPGIGSQGATVINADVDVSDGRLSVLYGGAATASGGAFNGYVFDFVPTAERPSLPVITGAQLSADTTFASGVSVTFDGNSLFINVSGLSIPAQSKIVVEFSID